MKQAFKKTLSLILAFTLSFGFLPSTVFAVEGETGMQDSGIAKPALTIGVSSITDSGAVLEFTSDQDGTVYYLVQESSKDKPNASTLQSAESTAVSAAEPVTIDEEGLLSDTVYTVYGIVVTEVSQSDDDVATNSEALDTGLSAAVTASPVVSRDFTTDRKNPAAPRLSFITAQRTAEGVDLTFEADQAGTYYCLIYETEAAAPDAAAVKAQGDAAGKASGSVTTGSAITILLTTELNMDKHYTASLVIENTQELLSEVQSLPIEAPVMLRGASLTGTPDTNWYTDPSASSFTISTADQLAGLAKLLDGATPTVVDGFDGKTVTLTQDIDLSDYQSGSGWVPIGGDYSPFKGTFDGAGHTVTGLTAQGYGLFNTVDGGTVQNLQLDGINITAPNGEIAGGIAATLDGDGIIENCSVSGTISALDSGNVGGVAGKNTEGTIRNCISTVAVSGKSNVGGIAGSAKGTIEKCYAKGNIASDTSKPAYSSGGIVGTAQVGATIIYCAAMNGSATGPTGGTGRVVGVKVATANLVDNNYAAADMQVNNSTITGGTANDLNGAPKTTANWFEAATWGTSGLNWDTSVWEISDGSLPALKAFGVAPPASFITITQHPASITNAIVGNISGSLSVAASVAPAGALSYQWYQNTTESNAGGTAVSGENGETFGIPTTLTAGTYYYFCEVSAGATSVRSNVAKVFVSAVADTTAPIPGAAGVFRVETGSSATSTLVKLSWTKASDNISTPNKLKYYVYCSDSDNISTAQDCENNGILLNHGGTTDINTLSTIRPGSDTAEYFNIVVEDEAGNKAAYQPAVRNGIVFSTQPSGMTVVQGYVSGILTASATSVPSASVSYQWYVRNIDVYAVPGTDQINGATDASFTLPTNLTTGDYYYYCKASIDGYRIWAYSDKVKVTVLAEAVTPTITGPTSLNLNEGYSATSTETYTIAGTAPVTVRKTAGAESITWNDTTKKLDIAAGLTAGSYAVTLEASHPSEKKGTLTFTLTVDPDPDTVAAAAAKSAAENATYSNMTQTTATSETIISDALKATAEAAVNNPSVSVTINKVDYTAPTAGSAGSPSGTNGSYVFTVTVSKGSQSQTTAQKTITITATAFTGITNAEAVAAAKTALVDGSVNVAFGATQAQKTAAVQSYVNGLLTGDAVGVTATVMHSSGNQYHVALSKGNASDSKNLSMTINEAPDPDIAIVNTAKSAAENATYSNMTQVVASSETIISDALKATAEAVVNNPSVSVTINKVDYTAPTAGSAGSPIGTNGSYVFTVTVSKGAQSQTTAQKTITITATAFTGITNAEAVAAAKTALVDGSVNVAFGATQAQKTAAVQSYVNSLLTGDAAGVTATVTHSSGNQYQVTLSKGSASDSKSLSMVAHEVSAPVTVNLVSIKTALSKTIYTAGEALNLSGLVVVLHKSNGDIENVAFTDFVSKGILVSPANGVLLATSHTKITITHVLSGKSVDYAITVKSGSDGNDSGGSSSGGSSSGSTTTPAATTPGKAPNQPITAAAPVTATADQNGAASASIPEKSVTDAIAKAQAGAKAQGKTANGTTVALNVTMPKGATTLSLNLTRNSLNSLVSAGVTSLELNGSPVTVSFDTKALAEIQKQSSGNISITIAPNAKLSAAAKGMIGTRPVYDLTVSYTKDSKNATVSSFGGGTATVSVPYTPAKGEAIGGLYAVYVDAKGNATRIAGSAYDANSGCVMFTTTHFSLYGIGYTAPSAKFTDITTHWAKESIDYVVGRGLLSGTAETTFAPDTAMTRGMLVTALGRLAGVDTKAYATNSFTDVKADSAFRPYIEWAYKKGVVQGTGNGKFEPDRAITREEIAVIFANFAKATGYTLPVTRTATTYADASSIGSTYQTAVTAMQQAGIMMGGTSNKFNPKSSATRAEVSSMLHRYIKLTIDPATAQGWALNDAGQYLYYKDSKALTGAQTINGVKYFFNADGTLKTGWVKDDAGNWRFYSDNTMLVGFWDLGANGNNKTYYFNKDGIMVAGKWLEIDGKWYYFNADGSLAKSTKIDDYEVDEEGVRKTK